MRFSLKLDPIAFLAFIICALAGIAAHLMIFLPLSQKSIRLYHNISLGIGYDIMNAAALVVIVAMLSLLINTKRQALLHGAVVFAYTSFVFTDYIYIKQFGTHLPFSTIEYLGEISTFSSNIGVSMKDSGFLILFLFPMLLFIVLSRKLQSAGVRSGRKSVLRVAQTVFLLLLVGGLAGSYSNSYVSKNINDPLTSSGAFYFYASRKIEKEVFIEKPLTALKVVTDSLVGKVPLEPQFVDYPLVRTIIPTTCKNSKEQNEVGKILCGIKKPNVLFLMLESFRSADIGIYGGDLKLTPNFDRLSQKGIFFKDFYANGFQTRHGQVAAYCSLMPNYGAPIMKRYHKNGYFCLPQILKSLGYHTSWINGADAAFDGQIKFFPKIGIDKLIDKFSFDSGTETLGWGFSDQALFDKWTGILDQLDGPFFSTALTTTNHHPFDVPDRYKLYKDPDDTEKYHEAMHYTDAMLGRFIQEIESKPWYSNTLVFIFADTSNYQKPQKTPSNFENFVKLRSQVPLLILGGQVNKNLMVEDFYSQIDLAPTLMDLLGIEYTAHWAGVSMLSNSQTAIAYTNRPGNYWAVMSKEGRYYREADKNDHYYGFTEESKKQKLNSLGHSWIKTTQWLLQNNRYWPESVSR